MENELKNPSKNFRSEKFVWSEFLAEWKTAFSLNLNFKSFLSETLETLKTSKQRKKINCPSGVFIVFTYYRGSHTEILE